MKERTASTAWLVAGLCALRLLLAEPAFGDGVAETDASSSFPDASAGELQAREAVVAALESEFETLERRIRTVGSRLHEWDMGGGSPRELVALLARQRVVGPRLAKERARLTKETRLVEEKRLAEEAQLAEQRRLTEMTGRNWTSPATGMQFVWIPAMQMWVGKYEVTNAEYRKMKPEHDSKSYENHSLNGERQPVVYVNFFDAKAYAQWLTRQDRAVLGGMRYRLPSND